MLIRRSSLDSPQIATAIVDTDLALKHRIETLAALASALVSEVERLRAEVSFTKEYVPNCKSEAKTRQVPVTDEGIDFYREIELYEMEPIQALHRVHGSQRRALSC